MAQYIYKAEYTTASDDGAVVTTHFHYFSSAFRASAWVIRKIRGRRATYGELKDVARRLRTMDTYQFAALYETATIQKIQLNEVEG